MSDNIVSVRMPETLIEEMKNIATEQHYMDVSETVRAMIKQKIAEYSQANPETKQQLIESLQNMIQQLQHEAKEEQ